MAKLHPVQPVSVPRGFPPTPQLKCPCHCLRVPAANNVAVPSSLQASEPVRLRLQSIQDVLQELKQAKAEQVSVQRSNYRACVSAGGEGDERCNASACANPGPDKIPWCWPRCLDQLPAMASCYSPAGAPGDYVYHQAPTTALHSPVMTLVSSTLDTVTANWGSH
jgi:hypothetical protein